MPIEVGIWRIGAKPERLTMSPLEKESELEEALANDLTILAPQLLLVGKQVTTGFGKFIDLLAIDLEGNLVVIELKKHRTPREVVAQVLDYASWVQNLSRKEIADLFAQQHPGVALEEAFAEAFGGSLPDEINQSHKLIVVASGLDPSTERIINYLADSYDVPINAVFFSHFKENGHKYLARTWLIDPNKAEMKASKAATKKGGEPWNGRDFYVSIGEGETRSWEDCRKYGFVSGGGGKWYSQTLQNLFPGARVFVNIPKTGYVGIGEVLEPSLPVKDFTVEVNGKGKSILDVPLVAKAMGDNKDDPELSEYLVRVKWLTAVPKKDAYWEKGLFALQHTACQLKSSFTIEKVSKHFGIED